MFPWILLAVVRVIAGMTFSGVALEPYKIDHHKVKYIVGILSIIDNRFLAIH